MTACCNSKKTVSFRYSDGFGNIHGPFTSNGISGFVKLYRERRLRKYFAIDWNNTNTFTMNLTMWVRNGWIQLYLDYLWDIKMRIYYKSITIYFGYIILWLLYFLSFLSSSVPIIGIQYSSIQLLSMIIVSFLINKIIKLYSIFNHNNIDINDDDIDDDVYSSRYTKKLNEQYNNLDILRKKEIRKLLNGNQCGLLFQLCFTFCISCVLIIGSGNILNITSYKYWIYDLILKPIHNKSILFKLCVFILILLCLILLCWIMIWNPCIFFFFVAARFDPIYQLNYVIPDYYDIQNDITYFVLKPLFAVNNLYKNNFEYLHSIYHILHICIAYIMQKFKFKNEKEFCKKCGINPPSKVKKIHLNCIELYLRNKFSIYNAHKKHLNNHDTSYNGICDTHKFDNKHICFNNYQYFYEIHGYDVTSLNKINFKWLAILRVFTFRNFSYMIPLLPMVFAFYLVEYLSYYLSDSSHSLYYIVIIFDLLILILLIIVFLYKIYHYLIDFNNITKSMIFWMEPSILTYLNSLITSKKHLEDGIVAYLIRLSIGCCVNYIRILNENEIYYNQLIIFNNDNNYPNDIIQLIFDYLCDYKIIETYIKQSKVTENDLIYNVDNIKDDIQIQINKLNDNNNSKHEHKIININYDKQTLLNSSESSEISSEILNDMNDNTYSRINTYGSD